MDAIYRDLSALKPIRLTLTAETEDGRIVNVLMPFVVPEGMTLQAIESHDSPGSESKTQLEGLSDRASVLCSDQAQMGSAGHSRQATGALSTG